MLRQLRVHRLPVHQLPVFSGCLFTRLPVAPVACSPVASAACLRISCLFTRCLFTSSRFRGSSSLGAACFTAPRDLPCQQVLLSLVRNLLVETRVLLSLVAYSSVSVQQVHRRQQSRLGCLVRVRARTASVSPWRPAVTILFQERGARSSGTAAVAIVAVLGPRTVGST